MARERRSEAEPAPAVPRPTPAVTAAPAQALGTPAAVLALQSAAGNRAVTHALTVSRQRPETADAGGAPAARGSEPPELTARLDEIARRYRGMIAAARGRGANVAADNLVHFLAGTGGRRALDVAWLRRFPEVTAAERTNQERFETSLNAQANQMHHGDTRTFTDHWDRQLTGSGELYYASGTSTLTSTGRFSLTMVENEVTITGTITHHWHDPYDWNAGQAAYVPGYGMISDDDGLLMQQHRGARPFELEADWTQTLQGHIAVGRVWNTKRFSWSGP